MDGQLKTIEQIAAEKLEYRRGRANLPKLEKIRILMKLQKQRTPILRNRGIVQRVWQIDEEVE